VQSGRFNIDWAKLGIVTSVKDQGLCGSCWAFAAVGAVESLLSKSNKKYKNIDLSEKELVGCSVDYDGCLGGWMDNAFDYIELEGIVIESLYPYTDKSSTCKVPEKQNLREKKDFFTIRGRISFAGCDSLTLALLGSPVSVAVDASNWSQYSSGVLNDCGSSVNHGVLLVGGNPSYWRIKNSWGTDWGENGYIRILSKETCGICSYPSVPLV
jgi:C1A family cysteine protease